MAAQQPSHLQQRWRPSRSLILRVRALEILQGKRTRCLPHQFLVELSSSVILFHELLGSEISPRGDTAKETIAHNVASTDFENSYCLYLMDGDMHQFWPPYSFDQLK